MKILIVDDEEMIRAVLREYVEFEGNEAFEAADGMEAVKLCRENDYDLVLMDVMMPHLDGFSAVKEIKKAKDIPVIMLSARGEEYDKLFAFEIGVDDYVTKPFSPKEVVTRVRTVLRRTRPSPRKETRLLTLGKLRVNQKAYEVHIGDEPVKMTPREVELLAFLMKHASEVVSREQILNAVWGYDYYGDVRAVDTLLARVRGKIPEKKSDVTFRTIYGVGYMIEERHE